MPRPVSGENKDAPLRVLRKILEISQTALSERTDIPIDTVRSLENGRNKHISPLNMDKICLTFGGVWDGSDWVVGSRFMLSTIRLTKAFADGYHKMLTEKPSQEQQRDDLKAISLRTDALFKAVPKRHWVKLMVRFGNFLEECRQDLAPADKTAQEVFTTTQWQAFFSIDKSGQIASVQRAYPTKNAPKN
jgi:transcriptional regulator with XRE-family HTH domain